MISCDVAGDHVGLLVVDGEVRDLLERQDEEAVAAAGQDAARAGQLLGHRGHPIGEVLLETAIAGTVLDTTEVEYDQSAVTIAGKPAKTVSQLSTLDFGSTQDARHVPANGKMDHKTPKIAGAATASSTRPQRTGTETRRTPARQSRTRSPAWSRSLVPSFRI